MQEPGWRSETARMATATLLLEAHPRLLLWEMSDESVAFDRRITGPNLDHSDGRRADSVPPGLQDGCRLAAGACVRTCPAGYEDRGQVCVFRSYDGHGG